MPTASITESHNIVTRELAMQNCRRAIQPAGEDRVQNTGSKAKSLSDPGIVLDALGAASVADAIMVSVASPVSAIKLIAERASTTAHGFQELYGRRYDVYHRSGLNE
jgi:hypothetical protein